MATPSLGLPDGTYELLDKLQDQELVVPDQLTQYVMRKSGDDCKDLDLIRVASLAAQKFLAGVLHDAMQHHKMKAMARPAAMQAAGYNAKDKRKVLRTEDLALALKEYGVNLRTAPYFIDPSTAAAGR